MNGEELKIIIRAELEQFKQAMTQAQRELKEVGRASKQASKEVDGFIGEVNQQARQLNDLKQQYINLAAARGKDSKEAKEQAEAIKKLSQEYTTNRARLRELADDANRLDYSLNNGLDQSPAVDKTTGSASELYQQLQQIKNMSFAEMAFSFIDLLPQLKQAFAKASQYAKVYFAEAGEFIKQFFQSFNPNSQLYQDIGWTGWGDAIKGSIESLKLAFQSLTGGVKQYGKQIKNATSTNNDAANSTGEMAGAAGGASKAIAGMSAAAAACVALIVAYIAVIIALGVAMVKLTQNAINTAKRIKEVNSEASKIGLTVKEYSEWAYVLKQVGVEADKLSDFLKTLTDEQNAVRSGDADKTSAFASLGMSADEVGSMTQIQLFENTVAALQNVQNSTERASLAYRIFGEDAAELSNILYLTNNETASLANNFYALGAAPSDKLVSMSKEMSYHTTNLKYAWEGIKNILAEAVLPVVIAVVEWLVKAAMVVSLVLRTIFGIGSATKTTEKSFNTASGGVNKYTNSINGANKAAKELIRTTMGFDELNIMPKQPTASGSDSASSVPSGGYGGGGFEVDSFLGDGSLDKFAEKIEKYKGLIRLVWQSVIIGVGAGMAFMGAIQWNPVLLAAGIALAGYGIKMANDDGRFDHIIKVFEKGTKTIKTVAGNVVQWMKDNIFPLFTKAFWTEKFENVRSATSEKMTEISTKLSEKWNEIKTWFNENVAPVFTKDYWREKWDNIKTASGEKLDETKLKISEKWNNIKTWFKDNVGKYFTKDHWSQKFDPIKTAMGDKLETVKSTVSTKWGELKSWVKNNILTYFTATYWATKFSTISDGARSAFNGVISIVESAINRIVKKVNTISWKIPDYVPVYGGKSFGFNLSTVSIPRLAEGGIAMRSVLANIGEAGREAVLPLDKNTEWMDTLANKVRSSTPTKVVLMVGERELGYATIDSINGITEQTGELQLRLV